MDGLLRDKTRKPGKALLSAETVAKVLALPCVEPPGEATHWTGRAVARAVGVSLRAVQRIWQAHRACSRTASAPSRGPTIRPSPRRSRISSAYIAPPRHAEVEQFWLCLRKESGGFLRFSGSLERKLAQKCSAMNLA